MAEKLKALDRENRELRRANEFCARQALITMAELDRRSRPRSTSSTIIVGAHWVEPICKVLPVAPSTYHAHVAKRRDPARLSALARP